MNTVIRCMYGLPVVPNVDCPASKCLTILPKAPGKRCFKKRQENKGGWGGKDGICCSDSDIEG